MSLLPDRPGKAIWYAVLIWLSGFVWGSIIFMIPVLKATEPVPYISSNPAISFPIILFWCLLAKFLAGKYLTPDDTPNNGLPLGLTFLLTNVLLDLLVIVFAFNKGYQYYLSLSVWAAYAILVMVPLKVASKTSDIAPDPV